MGVTYESNSELQDDERKILPYAGVNWTAPLKGTKLSTLQIHSSFAKAPAANFKSDLLDTYGRPGNEPGASPIFGMGALKYGYNWITGINAGFGNNRIMTSVNFLVGHVYPAVIFPVPGGPALVANQKIKRNGISLDIQAAIANNGNFSCKLRTMVFYERFKYSGPGTVNEDLYFANPMLNDDLSPQVRGSVSVDMTAGKFFMQVQGLVRFRDEGYNNVDAFTRERIPISNHGLTFLVVGYSFGSEKSKGLQCDVSVQTRNLAMMKEPRAGLYYGSRYVGLGINVRI